MAAQETVDHKYVYDFSEGNKDLKDLLGGKGANLAEMTNLGLPVPPGFTITTEACKAYLATGQQPDGLAGQIEAHLESLERAMGKRLGDPQDPLLVSVRSGAKFSMPGMMETVLNVGLNDQSVVGLSAPGRRQRPVRLGLLPPPHPDVRQDRLRGAGRGVRARAGRGQERQGHPQRPGPGRRRPAWAGRRVQEDLLEAHRSGVPAAAARTARPGHPGGLRVVERRARGALPSPGADPDRPRHRGQRGGHGVRQPRPGFRHRCRVHP